jgi:hypothetical protein
MLIGEILIEVVFAAALVAAIGSFVYLVVLTVRERHLRPGLAEPASEVASLPSPPTRKSAPVGARRRAVLHRS